MRLIQGDVSANEPGNNLKQTQSGMHPRTELGTETLNSTTEEQLLQHIRLVVVRGLHKEVYQQNFHSMRQEEESIMHFVVRLWTQAILCEFCHLPQQTRQWLAYRLRQ